MCELVDLKNKCEHFAHSTKTSLEEHGEKVSSEVRANIESALSNLEEKIKGDDKDAIEAAFQQLETVSMELGKAVYESAAQQAGSADEGDMPSDEEDGGGSGDDDVIDAEYEVKDDNS